MQIQVSKKEGGTVTLTVEVSVEETEPYLERAAHRLAHKHQIAGFRPGKAPLSVIRSKIGDAALYEEAVQELIPKTLMKALKEHTIESVGQPEISVEKLAPDNPISYSAKVVLMPEVNLDGWRSVSIEKKTVAVDDAEVDAMVEEFREMQAKEVLADRAAKNGDKVEINFEVKREGVLIEGGKGTKYPLILGKGSMIPGFEEHVEGLKKGEKKTFSLTFPKPYMNEKLAGKKADFEIEVIAVYDRELPATDDAWAQRTIGKTYTELREVLRDNLKKEKQEKEDRRIEHEVMEKIIDQGKFSVIPDLLLESEVKKMFAELQDDVAARGMQWDKYLESIKKTREEIENGLKPHAETRAKSALAIRILADELKIDVSDSDLDKELEAQREQYKDDEKAQKQLAQKEYREYLKRVLINRKTIDNLVSLLVK